ncbi:restriction endonuclease [[Clostridium] spiroforme]|nr:restriction endonuclease [Thomasclavelia spiroformis]
MITQQDIKEFCDKHNYDIRKSHNGRWIDQKCTPDVIWSISDFILDYVDNVNEKFTVKDIWHSEYAKQTIAETYSKPNTDEKTAENEYDKVFSQPLNMFCYAGIIKDISKTKTHLYIIENRDVLEYISRNDVYALRFLQYYIEKVLTDSGLMDIFEDFFDHQDSAHFNAMKQAFIKFYHDYTPIKKDYEPKRIFTKVVNPLAFNRGKLGTEKGRISKHKINRSDMMYNQDNFRDVYRDKPKDVTRQEWLDTHPEIDRRDGYFEQMMSRSKKLLKAFTNEYRENISELTMFIDDQDDNAIPTQIHHIFPKNEYPEIMHFIENLIMLTPNQHYGYAHPNNNTHLVDPAAQKFLLIAKTYSIRQNLTSEVEDNIFEFSKFLQVLSVGWDDKDVLEIAENDYNDVIHAINYYYAAYEENMI